MPPTQPPKQYNPRRTITIALIAVLIAQTGWYLLAIHSVQHNATKTTATVVRLGIGSSVCYSDLCDHSVERYPVYRYYDQQGNPHTYEDKFFDNFKDGNPLRPIFGKHVGDKETLYYDNTDPDKATVLNSFGLKATLWLPTLIGIVFLAIYGVVYVVQRLKPRYTKTVREMV